MEKYKHLIKGTIWIYMKKVIKTCGKITHKLISNECDLIIVVEDGEFKKRFIKV